MTPEEIRAEAIELIARDDYLRRWQADGFAWETTTEAIRGRYRARAATAVAALATANLLPTGRETMTDYIGDDLDAVDHYRYVTEWKELPR